MSRLPLRSSALGLVAAASLLLLSGGARAASGGPDSAGYKWYDGSDGCGWVPFVTGGADTRPNVTTVQGPFSLGFTMPFYDRFVDTIWVDPAGYITFSMPGTTVSQPPQSLPSGVPPNDLIAAYWMTVPRATIRVDTTMAGIAHVQWEQEITPFDVPTTHLVLHADGSFNFAWEDATIRPVTVGYEDVAATGRGRTLYRNGTSEGAFPAPTFFATACVTPPAQLDCASAITVSCGSVTPSRLPATDPAPATVYSCTPDKYFGNEQVFRVDVAGAARLTATIDNAALDIFQVSPNPCAENACVAIADNTLDVPIAFTGPTYFVVDKMAMGGGDAFNFRLDCSDPYTHVRCDDVINGDTRTSRNILSSYSCSPTTLDGRETFYLLTTTTPGNLAATLTSPSSSLWVVIYERTAFETQGNCMTAGRGGAGVLPAPAGDYVIVVDGEAGASAPYTLTVRCGKQLDCSAAAGISCAQLVSGSTAGQTSRASIYQCSKEALNGGEDVYRFSNPVDQSFSVQFISRQPGQRLLVLQSCDEANCLISGTAGAACALFPKGDYFVVVDGTDSGAYQFAVSCSKVLAGVDLQVTNIDASALTGDCLDFDVAGTARVGVTNMGQGLARAPFDVIVFEDRNVSGDYEAAQDNLLGTARVSSNLGGGLATLVDVTSAGTLLFRDNVICAKVDPANAVAETNDANNVYDTGRSCEYRPPIGGFSPTVEWAWTISPTLPDYNQVDTVPLVGDVDGDTLPDIVFVTGNDPSGLGDGVIRVISGKGGAPIWSAVAASERVVSDTHLAMGDIDGDGRLEIIGQSNADPMRLVAIDDDGTFLWMSTPLVDHPGLQRGGAAVSIADLDCNGSPEIIFGANVFDANGNLFWTPEMGGTTFGAGFSFGERNPDWAISVVADLDGDRRPEVLAGPTAYKFNPATMTGEVLWHAALPDGFPSVGNFDGDDKPEVVIVGASLITLLEGDTGDFIWRRSIPQGGGGCAAGGPFSSGPATIADLDGDCQSEIGVAGTDLYTVFETDGTVKWSAPISDCPTHRSASSVFDFDGDGSAEIVYADDQALHVFRGVDGFELANMPFPSHRWTEMISIADVDADNNAEIILPLSGDTLQGLRIIGDANDNWVNTRRIWNQHSYHITNVNDDGTIPGGAGNCEPNSWQLHGTFRDQLGTAQFSAPDITISIVQTEVLLNAACQRDLRIVARVGNGGGINVGNTFDAWFYDGDPATGGMPLAQQVIDDLDPGTFQDYEIIIPFPRFGSVTIFALADDNGTGIGSINECREDNNVCSVTIENSPLPINPPDPVGNALRVGQHGSPNAANITAVLDWTRDEGLPRTDEHYHVLVGTTPQMLAQPMGTEPFLALTYVDSTPRATDAELPLVHFYKILATDHCEQSEVEP